jgi:hypothetical protein
MRVLDALGRFRACERPARAPKETNLVASII